MNILENFEKLNNKLTELLEENEKVKQQCKSLQNENQELETKFGNFSKETLVNEITNEFNRRYTKLSKENKELKGTIEKNEKHFQQNILNLAKENKNLLKENQKLKKEKEKQIQNLSEENKKIKQQYNNISKENQGLKEREKKFLEENTKLTKENQELKVYLKEGVEIPKRLGLDEVDENNININNNKSLTGNPQSSSNKSLEKNKNKSELYSPTSPISMRSPRNSRFNCEGNKIQIVIGLDFGSTFSGFSYCHLSDKQTIYTNNLWPGEEGYKTNTVLEYYENLIDVKSWGYPALFKRRDSDQENKQRNIVELFKLRLGNLQPERGEKLLVNYKKAITDYLREIGIVIKQTLWNICTEIDFQSNILLVLTVPAEYSGREKSIMRKCAYNAELIGDRNSNKLQFTTEPEAAAIHCVDGLKENLVVGTTLMVVDCGGGTVDLTTWKLLDENQLDEITENAGDYCGSTFIDKEFVKYLQRKIGKDAIDSLKDNHSGQLQYMIQDFCLRAKFPFTGEDTDFLYEMNLKNVCPALIQYITDDVKEALEEKDWNITMNFDDIKLMFDPIIKRILSLIHTQLNNSREACSLMFLVGGFSQSKYLQNRIKQEFRNIVDNISVPTDPISAISRGATIYGARGLSAELNNSNDNEMSKSSNVYSY